MKIFQINDGFCYYDATKVHPNLDSTIGRYPPDVLFVEAPDYVFEGWGYDGTQEGDARFLAPTPPEGWLYDVDTGTFYPENETAPTKIPPLPTPEDDMMGLVIDQEYRLTLLELGVAEGV